MVNIRSYEANDTARLEELFAELQDFERTLEINRVDGKSVAHAYLTQLLDECRRWDGAILVAEVDEKVIGFICILAKYDSGEVIEVEKKSAAITDLVVSSSFRGQGIGRSLLDAAEAYAEQHGAHVLRVGALAKNTVARLVYEKARFREVEIELIKEIKSSEKDTKT